MARHRFAHTWITAGWVLAAVGCFALLRRGPGWLAGLACLAVPLLHLPSYVSPGHADEAGRKPDRVCSLVITDAYLPELAGVRHTTIISNIPAKQLLAWTFLQTHRHTRFTTGAPRFKERLERDAAALTAWLEQVRSDALVVIDAQPGSPLMVQVPETADLTTLSAVLERQQVFARERDWYLPEGVTIRLWRKTAARGRLASH
jgi:hypothetical protein